MHDATAQVPVRALSALSGRLPPYILFKSVCGVRGISHMTNLFAYAATIFISSMHLFLVQPIIAKQILPSFGGSANVWTTCLFFFILTVALLGLSARQIADEIRSSRLLVSNFYGSLRVIDTLDKDEPLRRLRAWSHPTWLAISFARAPTRTYFILQRDFGHWHRRRRPARPYREAPVDWCRRPRRRCYRSLWRTRRKGAFL